MEFKNSGTIPFNIAKDVLSEDYIQASVVFSGVTKIIASKQLKGGTADAVFGNIILNLTQADFKGVISLETSCVFGSVEIIVPANWEVRVQIESIMANVEDQRVVEQIGHNPENVLILKGSCVFGSLEIRNNI